MRSPTKRGVRTKLSINCPSPNTTATMTTASAEANCNKPASKANNKPTPKPKYGTKTAKPVKTPIGNAKSRPNRCKPSE